MLAIVLSSAGLFAADAPTFDKAVKPVLTKTCTACHNSSIASGGFNAMQVSNPQSVTENRDAWEMILQKVRSGEMPPKGIPKPAPADLDAFMR